VTVCVAARAGNVVVGATDRMLTAADIQFEPSAGAKLLVLSSSLFMMTAGDSSLQAEIAGMVLRDVTERINQAPENWWRVSEVADLYVKHYNDLRNKRAEHSILAPLGLTLKSFQSEQQSMSEDLVNGLAKELLNFELPSVGTIFGGLDPTGAHIYVVHENEPNCYDGVAFASIGIGHRHASSHFMFAQHAWNADFPDTLMLTYYAKRKAEAAPGVGRGTDMIVVGPEPNSLVLIGEHVIKRLDQEYVNITKAEASAFTKAKSKMRTYVDDITRQAKQASASTTAGQQAPSPADGGAPSADKPAPRKFEKD
jgi:hypothetical protein